MQSYILLYRIALNTLSIILYICTFEEIANRMLLASIQGFVCAYTAVLAKAVIMHTRLGSSMVCGV